MSIKYLSDGRKVIVIGQLNNVETIVQEIFVSTAGDEIPSGERFVVKSLHDAPVESWKARQEKELDLKLKKIEAEIEQSSREYKETNNKLKSIKELLSKSKNLEASFTSEHVERVAAFMTGQIEYLVIEGYRITPPVKMIDNIIQWNTHYGERSFKELKLISVLGRSNNQLDYQIHRYYDGSGGSEYVYPCLSLEEAKERIKNRAMDLINADRLSEDDFKVCETLAIDFDKESLDKYYQHQRKINEANKERYLKEIANLQKRIDEIVEPQRQDLATNEQNKL